MSFRVALEVRTLLHFVFFSLSYSKSVPFNMRPVVDFLTRRIWFVVRLSCVVFIVEKLSRLQVFVWTLRFFPLWLIVVPLWLYIH